METPTIKDTAIIRAAMAIEVRLNERTILRGAIRPIGPSSRPKPGAKRNITNRVSGGAISARAISTLKRPTKATTRLLPGNHSINTPKLPKPNHATHNHGMSLVILLSREERRNVLAGTVRIASIAGGSVANMAGKMPMISPFNKLSAETDTLRTLMTK
ncbi:Uncharacterised protein [Mycobacterium tuberculosis]|nr:Uncharacterised protein [Mycobacterium tuberculosis]